MLDWLSTSTLYREIIKKRSPYMTGVLLLHENKIHCVLIYLIFIMFRAVQAALFCIYSVPSRAVNGSARPLPNLMLSSSISAAELFDLCSVFRSVHFIHLIFLP